MKILRYLSKRIVKSIFVILVIALFNFLIIHMAPGDPATILAGQSGAADAEYLAKVRAEFGLDKPYTTQVFHYVSGLLTFDLGYSHVRQQTVWGLIKENLAPTLLLTSLAFLFALCSGVFLGVQAALRAGKIQDTLISTFAMLSYATPIFWVGLMLVLVFSVQLQWFPSYGYQTVGAGYVGFQQFIDIARHLFLPCITLGLFYMAVYTRLTRASMLEVKQMDFVKTARAKGLTERHVIVRHVLRNALLPIITYAGIQVGHLVGGSLLVETVFSWPGIGKLAFDALQQRDYSVLLGVFYIASFSVVVINLVTDVLYSLADPRIELK